MVFIIGLLAAVLFTLLMVLCALVVFLPTVFFTTFAATFLFLWGLGGYYILQWFSKGDLPAESGTVMGDNLNNWSGGRMAWLMDQSWKKHTEKPMANETSDVHGDEAKTNETGAGAEEKEMQHHGEPEENDQPMPRDQAHGIRNTNTKTTNGSAGGTT